VPGEAALDTALPLVHRVRARRQETADTVTLELVPDARAPAAAGPGQFNMLYAFGVGEVPISLSGHADDGAVRHTVRDVGAVTAALAAAPVGAVVGLRGPYGTGWDLQAAAGRDVLVVAGGLGLAPLRPVVHHVLEHRSRFGRLVVLVGSRADDSILYAGELDRWSEAGADVDVIVDHGSAGWRGHVGMVTELFRWYPPTPGTSAFVCGPEVMMRHTAAALVDAAVPAASVQVSLERNMQCAVARCGHCQLGSVLVCRDGPVLSWDRAAPLLARREL
jgi:NAD(P)H-flavin reductase